MCLSTLGRRRGAVCAALVSIALANPVLGQEKDDGGRKVEDAQRAEAQALVDLVEQSAQGKTPTVTLPLTWGQQYFVRAQGQKTYVPFTVLIDGGALTVASVGLYLRVVSRAAASSAPEPEKEPEKDKEKGSTGSQYAFEDLYFFDVANAPPGRPRKVARAFAVPPGEYDVYVAVKERPSGSGPGAAAPKTGIIRQLVTVPDFSGPGLTTSSVIVAEGIDMLQEPISPEAQADHPFTFGQMQIAPAVEHRFAKKDELSIVFWIYGAATDAQSKKPNVVIDYKFHRKDGDKLTYFNRTDPQTLSAETLPPQFDLAAGHQLSGSLAVPLASFPEGDYRLDVEIQDKTAGKQLTRDVNFTVVAQ